MSQIRVDSITDEVGTSSPDFPNGAPAQSGQVAFFAMDTAPTGWLKANGAAISRTTYSALFDAIGTTFGAGDGSTTFELPDLRGEFPRGWDDGRGVDSGRSFGTAQLDQMQRITGNMERRGLLYGGAGTETGALFRGQGQSRAQAALDNSASDVAIGFDSGSSPDARVSDTTDGETRSRNIALLACIKF